MRTAVDSSVLLMILRRQMGYALWQNALSQAAEEGTLVVCPVVFAECSVGFASVEKAQSKFATLGIRYEPFSPRCAWLAGKIFLSYRKNGGPRKHLVPDFLIGAHALVQSDRLAAVDRGYLRVYFPKLTLLNPST